MRVTRMIFSAVCLMLVLSGLGAGPLATAAHAQDLTPVLGPLARSVALGTSGSWAVLLERGSLVLSDANDPGAIRFYNTTWQGDRSVGRSVGVRVHANGMEHAAAGLIYNIREEYPRWAGLVVTPDNNIAIVARQQSGLAEIHRFPIPGGPHAEGELLQISEHGAVTTMLANGVELERFNMASAEKELTQGPVGIVAVGPGRFAFRDFAFGQEVVGQSTGDDRVPGRPGPTAGNDDRVPSTQPASTPPATDGRRWPVPRLDPLAADVLGATMGIVAHEFGHFVIGELKLPSTGPEEDVADEFAAMVFVDNMRDMPEQSATMALSLAKFWWYSAEDRGDGHQPDWFDEHAPDRARFGRIMCMLYGAAPRVFEDVMQQTGIPERTRARCIDDERKRHASWDTLLRTHRRKGVDPVMPGDLDPSTPGKRITVEYQAPANQQFQPIENFLQRSRMLDTAADLMSKLYVLPRDTKLSVRQCDEINAFYNSQDGSVTLCYEMVAYVLQTFSRHEGADGPVAGDTSGQSTPANTKPTPQPAGSSMNIAQFLAGTWRLQMSSDNGVKDDILVQASADSTYKSRHNITLQNGQSVVIGVMGRWSVEPVGNGPRFTLTLTPQQWSPRQLCNQSGSCNPLNLDPTRATVQIKDRNTLISDQGTAVRVQ